MSTTNHEAIENVDGKSARNVILVTGATGHVGRHVVSQLLCTGAAVRALARDPASAGLPGGVDVVRGDLSTPDTLNAGLNGVDAVFLPVVARPHGRLRACGPGRDRKTRAPHCLPLLVGDTR